jgi:hypothetical protein
MSDLGKDDAPKPETLKLHRKTYPPFVIALGILAIVLALFFLIYELWSALQPPELQQRPPEVH